MGYKKRERLHVKDSRFCLVLRRLSLDVNLREVPACASSPVTCVSRSPLFKTKVRNSTRLRRRQDCSRVSSINERVDLVLPATEHANLDVHPFPIHVFMFGERTLLLVTHLLRKSLFIFAKRTNHRPPSPGYRKSRAKRELSGSLDVEAIMVVNA